MWVRTSENRPPAGPKAISSTLERVLGAKVESATADAWDADAEAATANLPPQDASLEATMALVRELAETGRRIRVDANRRQRLPCREGWIVAGPDLSEFHDLLEEELNVEVIQAEADLDRFQRLVLAPNFRALAPKARR